MEKADAMTISFVGKKTAIDPDSRLCCFFYPFGPLTALLG